MNQHFQKCRETFYEFSENAGKHFQKCRETFYEFSEMLGNIL